MSRRLVSLALALAVGLGATVRPAAAAPAVVEPTPEARAANARALELSKAGDYAAALAAFQEAFDLSPSYLILYNIGRMARLTGDYPRAYVALRRYLDEGADAVDKDRRREVEGELTDLRGRIAALTVRVDEVGAEIEVDGRARGKSPLEETLWLAPGDHRVVVLGSRTETVRVSLSAGAEEEVQVALKKPPPPPGRTADPGAFRFPSGWVTAAWIATGVLASGATVTGTLALVTESDLEDDVYVGPARTPPDGSEVDAKADRLEALAITTDVLVVLACVSGAAAISVSVIDGLAAPDAPAPRVSLRAGPLGFAVVGTFE